MLVPEEDDAVLWDAGGFSGAARGGEEGELRDEGFGARVAELEGELVGGVEGVGRGDDGAGPESAEGYQGGVDRVGGVEGEDVAAGGGPVGLEAAALG